MQKFFRSDVLSRLQARSEHSEMDYSSEEESDYEDELSTAPDLRDMCLAALGDLSSATEHQLRELVCMCIRKNHLSKQWIRSLSTASANWSLAVELDFSGSEISHEGLALAAEIPSLLSLSLEGCRNVTDSGLALFRGRSLVRLNLSRCPRLTTEAAEHIASFGDTLTYLEFADHDIPPSAISSMVSKLPKIEFLNLARTRVSQGFLETASRTLDKLRVLDLASCPVSHECFLQLGSFAVLSVIDLSNTPFTKQALQALKQLLLSKSQICSVTVKPPLRLEIFYLSNLSSKLSIPSPDDHRVLCDAKRLASAIVNVTCGRDGGTSFGMQHRASQRRLQFSTSTTGSSTDQFHWPSVSGAATSSGMDTSPSADQLVAAYLSMPTETKSKREAASPMSSPMSSETRSPYHYDRSMRTGELFVALPRHPEGKKSFQTIERTSDSRMCGRKRKSPHPGEDEHSVHTRKRQRVLPEHSNQRVSLSRQYQQIAQMAPRQLRAKALRNHTKLSTLQIDRSTPSTTTTTFRMKTKRSSSAQPSPSSAPQLRQQPHRGGVDEDDDSRKPSLSRQYQTLTETVHATATCVEKPSKKDRMLRKRRQHSISSLG